MATRTKSDGTTSGDVVDNTEQSHVDINAADDAQVVVSDTPPAKDEGEELKAKLAKKQQERMARRQQSHSAGSANKNTNATVPTVRIKIEAGGGGSYHDITRNLDGTPRMYKQVLARGANGRLMEQLLPDIGGNLHMKKREIKLHEGSEFTMYADEAAGFVYKGYATLVEDHAATQIGLDELIRIWTPKRLRDHTEQLAAHSA